MIHMRHLRKRLLARFRHGKQTLAFIAAQNTRLTRVLTKALGTLTVSANAVGTATAGAILTFGANPADTKVVVIGSRTYTFQDTLTNVDGHVKIGANAAASLVNLFHALTASGGTVGTDYATAMTAHALVTPSAPTATTLTIAAKTAGATANSLATTTDAASCSWGASTMTGGVDAVVVIDGKTYTLQTTLTNVDGHVLIGVSATATLVNLLHALAASGGSSGTDYAAAMVAHTTIDGLSSDATTLVVRAKTAGLAGNSKATTTTLTVGSWGATTLKGGYDVVTANVFDLLKRHTADSIAVAAEVSSLE